MIKLPIKPIYLAFLVVILYFLISTRYITALVILVWCLFCLAFQYQRRHILQVIVILVITAGCFASRQYLVNKNYQESPTQVTQVQMQADTISVNGDKLSFRASSQRRTYQVFYKLKTEQEQLFFKNLDKTLILDIEADITEAEEQRNFKGVNYRSYLKTQGIYRIVQVKNIKGTRLSQKLHFFDYLRDWRRKVIVHINTHFPNPMRHYMTGLLFGYLDKEFNEMSDIYSSLGIIHLFALSGMQVSFFMGLFRVFLLRIGICKDWVDILTILISIIYAGLTGFAVSVIRSLLQLNLANLGLRKEDNFAITVLIMFFIMPDFLMTVGGVLSFTYAFIMTMIDTNRMKNSKLWEVIAINLGILPILCWYFGSFHPLAILLTAIFSLLFDCLILPLLSLLFILSPLISLHHFNGLFQCLEWVLVGVHTLFSKAWIFGSPTLIILFLSLLSLACISDFYCHKKVVARLGVILVLLFLLTKHPLKNEVTIVDVGQGDSIFLRDMWGKTILVDVGGRVSFDGHESWQRGVISSNAERTLIPYLKSRGVGKIDQLVLTHTDTDHMGDMEEVAGAFNIGEIIVSQGSLTNPNFLKRLESMNCKIRTVTAGDRLSIMGSHLQVLYPIGIGDGSNNDSLVLYGKLLNKRFLLTGDLEEGELDLIQNYPNLPVDILKAGHHGSKGSSYPEFLDHISAEIVLISAGKNNRYQHPHLETLERFKERQIKVYRTDQEGAIRFTGWRYWEIDTVR